MGFVGHSSKLKSLHVRPIYLMSFSREDKYRSAFPRKGVSIMTYASTEGTTQHAYGTCCAGATFPFTNICEPGCYICNWSGHLLRVPDDGIAHGGWPMLNIVGPDQLYVTKISDNPFLTVGKARQLAANFDLAVNF